MDEQLVGRMMMIHLTHVELESARDYALKWEGTEVASIIEALMRRVEDEWYDRWYQADLQTRKEIVNTGSVPAEIYREFIAAAESLKKMEECIKQINDVIESMRAGKKKDDREKKLQK